MNTHQPLTERLIAQASMALGRLFYPNIESIGELPSGPLILIANHPNGLLDGLVLQLACERPVAFLAKSTFFANPVLKVILQAFYAIPVYRPADKGKAGGSSADRQGVNDASFAAAYQQLANQGVLAIFPEGTPNPGPVLLPLKTGVARIGLGAEAQVNWKLGLQIVPVGLWFEDQARERTAALLLIGAPIGVADYAQRYTQNPAQAVRELTNQLQNALAATASSARQHGPAWLAAHQSSRMGRRRVEWWLVLAAPLGLIGLIMASPGLALAWLVQKLLTMRHRALIGTARLVALLVGLLLGWLVWAGLAWLTSGWLYGLVTLIAGPASGYIALLLYERQLFASR